MLAGKKLVIFDVYGTLLSTGTGSVEAVRSILAFSPQSLELPGAESFYAVWKRLHRKSVDRCISSGAFVTEAQMYRAELCELYALYGIERDDVARPQNAGLAAVWIDRKGDALPEDIRPDAVISSLSELRDVLT